jgi:hypothetical protein
VQGSDIRWFESAARFVIIERAVGQEEGAFAILKAAFQVSPRKTATYQASS